MGNGLITIPSTLVTDIMTYDFNRKWKISAVSGKNLIFWDVMLCKLDESY
jgi:hypothetical protein